jgi:hypothetical protein
MFFKTFIAIACTGFIVATSAQAQEFPSKNVTLMMPYAAGGPGDTLTRIIGQGTGWPRRGPRRCLLKEHGPKHCASISSRRSTDGRRSSRRLVFPPINVLSSGEAA